jgi:hypothetical protein
LLQFRSFLGNINENILEENVDRHLFILRYPKNQAFFPLLYYIAKLSKNVQGLKSFISHHISIHWKKGFKNKHICQRIVEKNNFVQLHEWQTVNNALLKTHFTYFEKPLCTLPT